MREESGEWVGGRVEEGGELGVWCFVSSQVARVSRRFTFSFFLHRFIIRLGISKVALDQTNQNLIRCFLKLDQKTKFNEKGNDNPKFNLT